MRVSSVALEHEVEDCQHHDGREQAATDRSKLLNDALDGDNSYPDAGLSSEHGSDRHGKRHLAAGAVPAPYGGAHERDSDGDEDERRRGEEQE